jgi:copper chaperone CopZ
MTQIEQIELAVDGDAIHCDGCESRIEKVLGQLPGVLRAKADHQTQLVTLMLDAKRTPLSEVKEKLEFAGFSSK